MYKSKQISKFLLLAASVIAIREGGENNTKLTSNKWRFKPSECLILNGRIANNFDITGPFTVIPSCCKAIKNLADYLQHQENKIFDIEELCDQYGFEDFCWSAISSEFQYYIGENQAIIEIKNLLMEICPISSTISDLFSSQNTNQNTRFSDQDYCEKTSKIRNKIARQYCTINQKYKKNLSPGAYCEDFNDGPYDNLCGIYRQCVRNSKTGLCEAVTFKMHDGLAEIQKMIELSNPIEPRSAAETASSELTSRDAFADLETDVETFKAFNHEIEKIEERNINEAIEKNPLCRKGPCFWCASHENSELCGVEWSQCLTQYANRICPDSSDSDEDNNFPEPNPVGRNLEIEVAETFDTETFNMPEIVSKCDGNLKMVIYIPSSIGLEFSDKFTAGKCDRKSPAIYLDSWNPYDAKFYINLKECHPEFSKMEGTGSISFYNQPITVSWQERKLYPSEEGSDSDKNEWQNIQVQATCQFTSDYIIDKLFDSPIVGTNAVIGNQITQIEENIQFSMNFFKDESYHDQFTDSSSGELNIINPFEKVFVELGFSAGFDPFAMVNVPTACYILQDNGQYYPVFSIIENQTGKVASKEEICAYPKILDPVYGVWRFCIDVPKILGISDDMLDDSYLREAVGSSNFKLECSVKICPNFRFNLCEPLIHECNYQGSNLVDV